MNFVSYAWFTKNQSGFGSINITEPENITCIQDTNDIARWLSEEVVKDKYGEKAAVCVLSFQKYQKSSNEGE